jgi:hypothetical protein
MLSHLLNALNAAAAAAATTATGAPNEADETEMHPDRASPRGVADVPEDSRDAKILLMPACTRTPKTSANADSALIATTGKKGLAMTQQKDEGESEGTAGKKKRKRGGAGGGAGVSAATATTSTNHQVQIRADERSLLPTTTALATHLQLHAAIHPCVASLLPTTTALGTHLQLHAALMYTRSAIRRAYSTSNLGGIILISTGTSSTGMLDIDGTGGYGGSMMGHPVLAIRYCGWKDRQTGAIEVEYARAMTLERAERFLGCCTGAAPSRWQKFVLPARLAGAYLGLLQTTCTYRGYSCLESGCRVHEGVLP